jgi:membrane protease YdiL (CAAX protease family)
VSALRRLSHEEWFAAACCLVWTGSAVLSRLVGVWLAVGGVALFLGVLSPLIGHSIRPRLKLRLPALGFGIGAGAAMTAVTYLLFPLVRHLVPEVVTQSAALYNTFGQAAGWRAVLFLPLVVVGEELVWRGVVQEALTRRFGPVRGTLLAVAVYGLAVVPVGSPLLVAIALSCGLFWSVLRAWTGSLIAALACHLVWNSFVFLIAPLS